MKECKHPQQITMCFPWRTICTTCWEINYMRPPKKEKFITTVKPTNADRKKYDIKIKDGVYSFIEKDSPR